MIILHEVERRAFVLCVLLTIAATACDNPPTSPRYTRLGVGFVKVSVPTTGVDLDDAFDVLSDSSARPVSANRSIVFELPIGSHPLELRGTADNCLINGGSVRLVDVKANDTTLVVFSVQCYNGPVSRVIAFVEASTLMLMKPDGSGQTTLTRGWQPSWSRDGNRIVYSATACDDESCSGSLEIVDPTTQHVVPLPKTASGVHPAWSPVDDVVAYTNIELGALYLYDIAKETATKVTIPQLVYAYDVSWSPDGSQLVATCSDESYLTKICVFNRDGSDFRYLLPGSETIDRRPSWSPDGSRIAFERNVGTSVILVVNVDGKNLRTLPASGGSPSWSPDGREIVFSSRNGIFRINSDGTGLTQLTNGPLWSHYSPVWKR